MNSSDMTVTKRRRRPRGRTQIRDVARLAGVSAITVSRYINDPDKVAKDTRERIASAIAKIGYIPNMVAKGLSSNRTNIVAAIIPTITNSIFADQVSGLSDELKRNGHSLLISESGYSLEREAELIETVIAQRPAGIVVTGQIHTERGAELLRTVDAPVVETWEIGADPIDMCVGFSNFDASYRMVTGLIEAGYKRIGFICAPITANDRATRRREGYLAAMKSAGLDIASGWMRDARFTFQEGARAMGELLDGHADLEAVCCASDIFAIGGAMECQRRGLRLPDDLGICGFDDLELTTMTNPPLTTVHIPRYEIGQKSASMILARLSGERALERKVDLGFEIVWRGSTSPNPP